MRIALGIEYNGNNYHGWQAQQDIPCVQKTLEKALSQIANESIQIYCAGRTDKGVHAQGQVVHFDTMATRNLRAWTLGTNTLLPADIAVIWAKETSIDFHARYSASFRYYRYIIQNRPSRAGLFSKQVTAYPHKLNINLMQQAAHYLLGTHDFSAFRAAFCQAPHPIRTLMHLAIYKKSQFIYIDIAANAFLHHMVRNIVGSLLEVGKGSKPVIWIQKVLESKDRTQAGSTAPAHGLYFMGVGYPSYFGMPDFLEVTFTTA